MVHFKSLRLAENMHLTFIISNGIKHSIHLGRRTNWYVYGAGRVHRVSDHYWLQSFHRELLPFSKTGLDLEIFPK